MGGDSLRIDNGSILKFRSQVYTLRISRGRLSTGGLDPVWFTSFADDAVGGDTNADGNATSAAPGQWVGLSVGSASVDLNNAWFAYGGYAGYAVLEATTSKSVRWNGGGVRSGLATGAILGGDAVDVRNLTMDGNGGDGLIVRSLTPPVVEKIVSKANGGTAIWITRSPGHVPSSLSGAGNGLNGVRVEGTLGEGAPDQEWVWEGCPDFPIVIGNSLSVAGSDSLRLEPGTVVKFRSPVSRLALNHSSRIHAPGPGPVWFTSIADDDLGGDTNGDGAQTIAAPGQWRDILFLDDSEAILNNTWFKYGGNETLAMIGTIAQPTRAQVAWNGGGVLWSQAMGMSLNGGNAHVSGVQFAFNGGHGVTVVSNAASFSGCDFVENAGYGLINGTPNLLVDATGCWWGHETGPLDVTSGAPDYNPGGLGQRVSDWVSYRPFLTEPATNTAPTPFALLSPLATDTVTTVQDSVRFAWRGAGDADGDPIVYTMTISSSPDFAYGQNIVHLPGLRDTSVTLPVDSLMSGVQYWRVSARDAYGGSAWCSQGSATILVVAPTAIGGGTPPPLAFHVSPTYPNPFSDNVSLSLALPEARQVALRVYDVAGRLVRTVVNERIPEGRHQLTWDGTGRHGRKAASGVYFYRLDAGDETQVRRMTLLK